MLELTKNFPLSPIRLALLAVFIYYCVHFPTFLTIGLLLLLIPGLCLHNSKRINLKILLLAGGLALYFIGQVYLREVNDRGAPNQIDYVQVIPDTIRINGDSLSFRGKEANRLYQVFYRLQSKEEQAYFKQLGDSVVLSIEGMVTEAEGQRNFNGFDYQEYLETQGIYKQVSIKNIRGINRVRGGVTLLDKLSEMRRKAIVYIQNHFPSPMRHYMTGLLLGYLDQDFSQMQTIYSNLGIIHLFALSGMQVSFFVDKFRWFCLRLGIRKETVDLLQLPLFFLYAALTGFTPSVIRSLLQKLFTSQGISGLDNLGLTALISFLLVPNFLLTAGGVLSFAYAFILALANFEHLSGVRKVLAETVVVSIGILPLLAYYFSSFQPVSMVLTIFLSLIFDFFLLPLVSLVFILSPLVRLEVFNYLFIGLEALIQAIDQVVGFPVVLGQPSPVVLVGLFALLGFSYDLRQKRKMAFCLLLCSCLLLLVTKRPLTNELTMVDVGQGDSLFLRDIRGRTILIDLGGRLDFGTRGTWQERQTDSNASRTLIPYLRSRGVSHIDKLILTHTDTDHIGDLFEVAAHFSIGQIWVSSGSLTDKNFLNQLKKLKLPIHVVEVGDQLPIFDSHLEVLYPLTRGDGGNNDSIVLYGRLLGTNFLFTGDLEEAGEEVLMATYPNLEVDVLKAGHHGSKGSSSPAFLERLRPVLTLISAGKNNRYQHPHQETMERLKEIDSRIYRTDQEGAIRFIGRKSWQVETVK